MVSFIFIAKTEIYQNLFKKIISLSEAILHRSINKLELSGTCFAVCINNSDYFEPRFLLFATLI